MVGPSQCYPLFSVSMSLSLYIGKLIDLNIDIIGVQGGVVSEKFVGVYCGKYVLIAIIWFNSILIRSFCLRHLFVMTKLFVS